MWDPYAEFQSATLPNGLTVHAAHWPGRLWEAVGFLVHSGAQHDPVGLEGTAHFVEHLLSKNADVAKKDLCAFFDDGGGSVDLGSTNYPYTEYLFFLPMDTERFARVLTIFGHMLLSAKIEKCIESERQVIIGEFRRRYPFDFKFQLDMHEQQVLYSGHWLERFVSPFGNPESVGQITKENLQAYYNAYYTPANISVVGVGGMQLTELVSALSESPFAISKPGARTVLPVPMVNVMPPLEVRHIVEMSKYVNVPMEVGSYRSVARVPGDINEQTIRIFGNMFRELIMEEVRERRAWLYTIGNDLHNYGQFYEVAINCNGLVLEALDQIEAVIDDCLMSIVKHQDLFERAKKRALASNFMIDSTGQGVRNATLDDLAYHQRIISLAEVGRDKERVTMDDIRNLSQWLRPERRWTLIIRP